MTVRPGDGAARIPSLDGLRAMSIACVLVSHSFYAYGQTHDQDWLYVVRTLGSLGVSFFFGISGFIITTLLQQERLRSGRISASEFYVRRAFRILPPFWAYVAMVVLLGPVQPVHAVSRSLLFVSNYLPTSWWLGHTWSLSVEEQFYLLWPATMILVGARASRVAVFILALSPVIRVAHHLVVPTAAMEPFFHARMDALAIGCLVALEREHLRDSWYVQLLGRGPVAAAAAVFLVVGSPLLDRRFHGLYVFPFRYSMEAAAVASILLWAIQHPGSTVGRFLNWRPVVRLGVLSYSLYLWQQPFFSEELRGSSFGAFPLNILTPIVLAELSYRLVERPALRARDRVIAWMRARRRAAAPAA